MHVYAFPSGGLNIQYSNPSSGTSFRLGDFGYVADVVGDIGIGYHTLGVTTGFPGYCSRDALIAIIRDAIKTAANSTYGVTLTDDQVTVLGI